MSKLNEVHVCLMSVQRMQTVMMVICVHEHRSAIKGHVTLLLHLYSVHDEMSVILQQDSVKIHDDRHDEVEDDEVERYHRIVLIEYIHEMKLILIVDDHAHRVQSDQHVIAIQSVSHERHASNLLRRLQTYIIRIKNTILSDALCIRCECTTCTSNQSLKSSC